MKSKPLFEPINFFLAGKILFVLGAICVLLKGVDYLTGLIVIPDQFLFIGLGALIISVYIFLFVPRE